MTLSPLQRVRGHLAEVWSAHRERLRRILSLLPDSAAAPRWVLRLRILDYLIARYSDRTDLRAVPPPRRGWVHGDRSPARALGALPRSAKEIRVVLEHIADCNRRVHGEIVELSGRVYRLAEEDDLNLPKDLDAAGRQRPWN